MLKRRTQHQVNALGNGRNLKMKVYIQFPRTQEFNNAIKNKFSNWGIQQDNEFYYFLSPLKDVEDINEHILWILMILDSHRKFLKTITSSGIDVTCVCKLSVKAKKGSIYFKPQALALAHLLGIGIKII